IVHGGAWDIPDSEVDAHLNACRNALTAGWTILRGGGSALDAVQAAVMILEDDPALDAGIGSLLTADGTVELDAGIMRGSDLQCGAVASVRRIQNPIVLARRVMESDYVMFTGEGAEAFGVSQGMTLIDPQQLIVARERQKYERWRRGELRVDDKGEIAHDTVGAVAMDKDDHIVVGVSTGGTPFTPAGRVGDVPQVGCGFYADDTLGGAVSTGHGEAIARVVLAKTAVDLLRDGATAHEAAQMAVTVLRQRVSGSGGVIMIDADGRIGFAHNTTRMARGYISEGMSEGVFGV
ncbi:MAG: isoaspartyl peptidase/L-asparaginase, partial [Chloroflexota bacterium]